MKRIMESFLWILLTASLVTACGNKTNISETQGTVIHESEMISNADTNGSELISSETTNGIINETVKEETSVNTIPNLAAMSATELSVIMGNGINLGNTMESGSRKNLGTNADISAYETGWGMPVTTAEMLKGMKKAGFDTVRIPIAWTCAIDYEANDYTIHKEFIARIEEIVNYALDADMFVIINDHWDNQWWGMFGDADKQINEQAMTLYTEMWKGIATYFKDYDERLIFESANEELGNRLNDNWKNYEGSQTGVLTQNQCYEKVNEINQTFVDTVRKTGGNNDHRFLLIAGYNTDISCTVDSRFEMPKDTAQSKLLVSVHYYDPSNYCIFKSTDKWGVKADYRSMNETLAKLTKFTEAGYGVIIGEYGVLHDGKITELRDNTLEYVENFLNNCNLYGYVPVLWDCNSAYDRDRCKMSSVELGRLFTKYSYEYEHDLSREEVIKKSEKYLSTALEKATEVVTPDGTAWIMFSSSDWAVSYAVGDDHPTGGTDGIVATEALITGEGTYTVGLDFSGTYAGSANSTVFAAIGILNGENLFPGYKITITQVLINGEEYKFSGENYTTSDNQICTRTNLYNGWVTSIPSAARTAGNLKNAPATGILDPEKLGSIKSIEITFTFTP